MDFSKNDLSKVRVGDKIWTIPDKNVEVVDVGEDDFLAGQCWYRKADGFRVRFKDDIPFAFWSKPNIEIPPPPKRMVKSKIHFWHVYSTNGRLIHCFDEPTDVKEFTETEESANCFIKHYIDEIEVEE